MDKHFDHQQYNTMMTAVKNCLVYLIGLSYWKTTQHGEDSLYLKAKQTNKRTSEGKKNLPRFEMNPSNQVNDSA